MILTEILGNIHKEKYVGQIIPIFFEWFEVDKKRIKKVAEDGTEFGIAIHDILQEGDVLAKIDNSLYVCEIKPAELTKVFVCSVKEMGKLCFELGNRHLTLKIEEDFILVPYDRPTFAYLQDNGFSVEKVDEKFFGFSQYKAHVTVAQNALKISYKTSVSK